MKKLLILVLFLTPFLAYGQYDFRASMGLNMTSSPDLRDYINDNYSAGERMSDFQAMVEFAGEAVYLLFPKAQAGVEIAYSLNSYTSILLGGKYELSYSLISPTPVYYWYHEGAGYKFRFGGGLGPRFLSMKETKPLINQGKSYSSTGVGLVLKGDAATALSSDIYAYVSGDFRFDSGGIPSSGGETIKYKNNDLAYSAISFGIKLGILYSLR